MCRASGRMGEKMLGELGLEENCCTALSEPEARDGSLHLRRGKPPERTSGGGCNDDEDVEA